MKILNQPEHKKEQLPKGKLTIKWVSSRCVEQLYCGGKYVTCVSGENKDEVIQMLDFLYDYDKQRLNDLK